MQFDHQDKQTLKKDNFITPFDNNYIDQNMQFDNG